MQRDIIDRTLSTKHGESAYHIVEKLHDAGKEAYWVGGAVRTMLLGSIPHEIDISTSALPDEIAKFFPASDDTDKKLGAVRVSLGGVVFELTTFRTDDTASDGRHPESVSFGDRKGDAMRRDATINALYWNPIARELIDDCGGLKDLQMRLVRFIGDPNVRIEHDALRIWRMVRLKAAIEGDYELSTRKALEKNGHLSGGLSGMRIAAELEKILLLPKPSTALEDLWELGILKVSIPELHTCKGVAQPKEYHKEGDVFEHLKACTDHYAEDHGADVRLAALFHDIGKPLTFSIKERIRFDHHAEVSSDTTDVIFRRLQIPKVRREKICWLIRHHMMMDAFNKLSETRKAHWYFHPWFRELLQLFWLDAAGTDPGDYRLYDEIIEDYNQFLNSHPRPQKPLLDGDEIMSILGIAPGEEVGRLRQLLTEAQIAKKVTTKAEAKEYLSKTRKLTQ